MNKPNPKHQQDSGADICPLFALRTAKGMTQEELAAKSGINPRQIRRFETGEAKAGNITLASAARLAAALGVEISDLLPDSIK